MNQPSVNLEQTKIDDQSKGSVDFQRNLLTSFISFFSFILLALFVFYCLSFIFFNINGVNSNFQIEIIQNIVFS